MGVLRSIQSHIASFYDVVHLSANVWVIFLDKRMQFFIPPNIYLICGLVLILLCGHNDN